MKLLILGGTIFLGRHLVEAALARGHQVTLFHRGEHGRDLYEGRVERLLGDRDGGLDALDGAAGGGSWDAAIDTCGYLPRLVRDAAVFLAARAGHYTFVSSLSVYADERAVGQDERAARHRPPEASVEEVGPETYGPLKVGCEVAAEAAMPGRTLIVRPGLLVGPHDGTDRFTWWPARVARGGEVLLPPADTPCELTDARDLAAWLIHAVEEGLTGAYNVSGPAPARAHVKATFGELFEACRAASGADARPVFVDEAFLVSQHVHPWTEVPLWTGSLGPAIPTHSSAKAIADGLRFRPLVDTCRDTLAWHRERGAPALKAGLPPERDAFLLAAWAGAWRPQRK